MCSTTRSPGREADVDPKRVAIEVSPIPLPLRPAHPLPPWSCAGEGKPRFGTTLASHSWEDTALAWNWKIALYFFFPFFLSVFIFGGDRPVIVLNTCFFLPPSSSRQRQRVPFFAFIIFLPLSLLKVREWRRPISARLPFCEFNSEALPAFAWICLQTPRSLFLGCRGEAAASPGLRGGVFHIGALFGVCNLAVGR